MTLQAIVNLDDMGKIHIWTHESTDAYGGHYRSLCGHQFGIEWRLSNFWYDENLCQKCVKIAVQKGLI